MMVEDKGISTYDDACSHTSNEEDSLLSAGSSPNMTSPSSTSAVSGSGSSVDEGVDMCEQDVCKRILFARSVDKNICDNDQPLDLTMKKPRKNVIKSERFDHMHYDVINRNNVTNRRESGELVIDETRCQKTPENVAKLSPIGGLNDINSFKATPIAPAPHSLALSYLPWSHIPKTSVPTASTTIPSFWHPAFFMTQAARHFAPTMVGMPPFTFAPTSTSAATFQTPTNALHQIYGQNVLSEFSRICNQANTNHCGGNIRKEPFKPVDVSSKSTKRQSNTESAHERYARENGISIKTERDLSPDYENSRKRKFDEGILSNNKQNEPNYRKQSDISAPLGKRIREDYKNGLFDNALAGVNCPPTMIPNMYNTPPIMDLQQTENSRVIPKPVDFKPCRFPCNECGRTYATVGGLLKHSKTHHETETASNFKCKTCDKEYNSLGALKMHIRTHTLPCKCHICGKAFSRTWLLQGHIRTHTGEKPYQCTVCSRAFADRSNLRAHMQTHESVKRYACTSCDKTFSRISLLNRHRVGGCAPTPA